MQLNPILNSRDIDGRVADLQCYDHLSYDDTEELAGLVAAVEAGSTLNEDWDLGEDLYRDDFFMSVVEVNEDFDEDFDNGPTIPLVQPEVSAEFDSIDILGTTYWVRCTC
jgi:hypothetical protein